MPGEGPSKENEERLMKALSNLQTVADSGVTPRNLRKSMKDAITVLQDAKLSPTVRAANAISILDEVSQDPNLPSFIRVSIWSAVSNLEAIKE